MVNGRRYDIRAHVHKNGGYSAHAVHKDLVDYVMGIPTPPGRSASSTPVLPPHQRSAPNCNRTCHRVHMSALS